MLAMNFFGIQRPFCRPAKMLSMPVNEEAASETKLTLERYVHIPS